MNQRQRTVHESTWAAGAWHKALPTQAAEEMFRRPMDARTGTDSTWACMESFARSPAVAAGTPSLRRLRASTSDSASRFSVRRNASHNTFDECHCDRFALTSEYPIDFSSTVVHGYKSRNLYRSTSCAVSLPSNSLSCKMKLNLR